MAFNESGEEDIMLLNNGCLCCTVRGELVDTLADLVERLHAGSIGVLARVVV